MTFCMFNQAPLDTSIPVNISDLTGTNIWTLDAIAAAANFKACPHFLCEFIYYSPSASL